MRTIKWGIMGAGNISAKFAQTLKEMKNTELVAVAARNLERAEKFASEYQIDIVYGSYEELVKDSDIDVIYIGTINTAHKENAALAITHGKAVLCEKPFTLNECDTKYLIKLAKEHQVFLMEAMWTKFLPATKKVKEWLLTEKIGKIKKLQISFGFQRVVDPTSRLFNIESGGGALLDVGIYPITYAIHLMEELPVDFVSSALILHGVDEQNSMIFRFEKGVLAELSSAITAEIGKDAILIGEKGRIHIPHFWEAEQAVLYDETGKVIEHFKESNRITGYEHEIYEVNECIREGKLESDVLPLADTLDIIQIMESIRKSWKLEY